MGFFAKIKENLTKGGVKISLDSPGSARLSDPFVPLTINVTNGETARDIKVIGVKLEKKWIEKHGDHTSHKRDDVVTYQIPESSFTLQPNETKSFAVTLPLSASEAFSQSGQDNEAIETAAGVFDKVVSVANAMDNKDYSYSLIAWADVDGIAIDPSDRNSITLLSPGQFGTTFNI